MLPAHYALQRGYKGRPKVWLSFDYAPNRQAARAMLRKARRLFPAYAWRITLHPYAMQDPATPIWQEQCL